MSAELIEQLRTELADSILDCKDLEIQVAIARKQRDEAIRQAAELRQQIDALSDGCAFCGSDAHATQACPMRSRGMEKGGLQLRIEAQTSRGFCDCNQGRLPCACKQAAPAGEREAFEAIAADDNFGILRVLGERAEQCGLEDGDYIELAARHAWSYFQAGAAYQRAQQPQIAVACDECKGLGFGPFGACGECCGSGRKEAQQPQSAEEVAWRSMEMDPPKKTGRYCVGHRGNFFGHAYYTARAGDTHYPVGWNQVPKWRPSHWLDVPYIGDTTTQPSAGGVMPDAITVSPDWLKQIHRDLDACQKLIWANLRGCDPAYCADAQARLAEIEEMLARLNGKEVGRG